MGCLLLFASKKEFFADLSGISQEKVHTPLRFFKRPLHRCFSCSGRGLRRVHLSGTSFAGRYATCAVRTHPEHDLSTYSSANDMFKQTHFEGRMRCVSSKSTSRLPAQCSLSSGLLPDFQPSPTLLSCNLFIIQVRLQRRDSLSSFS